MTFNSSDDIFSLYNNKKSVLQSKYRPLFLKNKDQIQTTFSENIDQNIKIFYSITVQIATYIQSKQIISDFQKSVINNQREVQF